MFRGLRESLSRIGLFLISASAYFHDFCKLLCKKYCKGRDGAAFIELIVGRSHNYQSLNVKIFSLSSDAKPVLCNCASADQH